MRIGVSQQLAVVCKGHVNTLFVQKLICFRSKSAKKRAMKHAIAVLSRRQLVGLKNSGTAITAIFEINADTGFFSMVVYLL